ncbi:MAG TPA: hypothetical protein VIF37_19190 [Methylobacter sp.]|jgi:hypothetical protein
MIYIVIGYFVIGFFKGMGSINASVYGTLGPFATLISYILLWPFLGSKR